MGGSCMTSEAGLREVNKIQRKGLILHKIREIDSK